MNRRKSIYVRIVENQQKKEAPPNFRIADKCCIMCNHCYDENSITACTKHNMFIVEWFNICNDFCGEYNEL